MKKDGNTSVQSVLTAVEQAQDRVRGEPKGQRAPLPPAVDRLLDTLVTRLLIDIHDAEYNEKILPTADEKACDRYTGRSSGRGRS